MTTDTFAPPAPSALPASDPRTGPPLPGQATPYRMTVTTRQSHADAVALADHCLADWLKHEGYQDPRRPRTARTRPRAPPPATASPTGCCSTGTAARWNRESPAGPPGRTPAAGCAPPPRTAPTSSPSPSPPSPAAPAGSGWRPSTSPPPRACAPRAGSRSPNSPAPCCRCSTRWTATPRSARCPGSSPRPRSTPSSTNSATRPADCRSWSPASPPTPTRRPGRPRCWIPCCTTSSGSRSATCWRPRPGWSSTPRWSTTPSMAERSAPICRRSIRPPGATRCATWCCPGTG